MKITPAMLLPLIVTVGLSHGVVNQALAQDASQIPSQQLLKPSGRIFTPILNGNEFECSAVNVSGSAYNVIIELVTLNGAVLQQGTTTVAAGQVGYISYVADGAQPLYCRVTLVNVIDTKVARVALLGFFEDFPASALVVQGY